MFHLLLEWSDHFDEYLDRLIAEGELIECREISARYTADLIGSCAFSNEMNVFAIEESYFRRETKYLDACSQFLYFLHKHCNLFCWKVIYWLENLQRLRIWIFFPIFFLYTYVQRNVEKVSSGIMALRNSVRGLHVLRNESNHTRGLKHFHSCLADS